MDISRRSGGEANSLDINDRGAADKLTGVVSTLVLKNVGGSNGAKLVEQYKQKYGGFT